MNLSEIQQKDIISIKDGRKIGRIIDAEISTNGNIEYLILEQPRNIRSLFNNSDEIKISFKDIEKIGSDVILVNIWYNVLWGELPVNKKILTVAMITLAIDQISKAVLESIIKLGTTKTIINNFFYLTSCHNDGAAWGILSNQTLLITLGTTFAFFVIYRFIYTFKENKRNNIAFGLVLGGLAGNLIDRVFLGYVRDFFDFLIFNYSFPVFNVADVAIVIGVFLLIIAILKGEDVNENNGKRVKRETR